jgi:hypothetical protein
MTWRCLSGMSGVPGCSGVGSAAMAAGGRTWSGHGVLARRIWMSSRRAGCGRWCIARGGGGTGSAWAGTGAPGLPSTREHVCVAAVRARRPPRRVRLGGDGSGGRGCPGGAGCGGVRGAGVPTRGRGAACASAVGSSLARVTDVRLPPVRWAPGTSGQPGTSTHSHASVSAARSSTARLPCWPFAERDTISRSRSPTATVAASATW